MTVRASRPLLQARDVPHRQERVQIWPASQCSCCGGPVRGGSYSSFCVVATLLHRIFNAHNIVRPLNNVHGVAGTVEQFRTRLTFLFHSTSRTFWQPPGLWAEQDKIGKGKNTSRIK